MRNIKTNPQTQSIQIFEHQMSKQKQPYGQLSTSLVLEEVPSPKLKNQSKKILSQDLVINNDSYENQNIPEINQYSPGYRQEKPSFNEHSPNIRKIKKPKNHSKPAENQDALLPLLKQSQQVLYNKHIYPEDVSVNRNDREHKVYDIQIDKPPKQILNNMYNQLNRNNKQLNKEIQQVMGSINSVQTNPKHQKLGHKIPKNKDNLRELEEIDKYRLLKIKNGQIKNKVGNLREKLEDEYYAHKALLKNKLPEHDNIKESDYYSLQNPKTHEAQNFIADLKRKRQQQHQMMKEKLQYERQLKEQRKYQEQMQKMQQRQQKIHIRQIQYAERQMKKKLEEKEHQKKKQEIKQWSSHLKSGDTPLYIKKEQQFIENSVIPKIYERHRVLDMIHKQKKLDFQQIDQHNQWYMGYKSDEQVKKQMLIDLKRNELQEAQQQQNKYYKGLHRYNALEGMYKDKIMSANEQQQRKRQIERVKRARQLLYSDEIREKQKQRAFKTVEHPKKQFKKRTRNINGTISVMEGSDPNSNRSNRTDPQTEGKRNLHYIKNLVKQKGIKNDKPIIRLVEQRGVYPNYMEQLRQKRINKNNASRVSYERYNSQQSQEGSEDNHRKSKRIDKNDSNNINKLKAISLSLDERMKRNHLKMKMNKDGIEFEDDRRMEDEDIQAVRAKLKLMGKVN